MASTTSGRRWTIVAACALLGCAAADDPTGNEAPARDSGRAVADTTGALSPDSGADIAVDRIDTAVDPADSALDPTDTAIDPMDTAVAATDTGAPIDTSVFTDTAPTETTTTADGGCGGPIAAGVGATCTAPVPISMDSSCTQVITGDSCTGAALSTSCGAVQGIIHSLQVSSGVRLYDIAVSAGFQLATIGGPPICGGAGSCVGTGMSTGVSAGSTQWWVVAKVGGGCGPYALTITPR